MRVIALLRLSLRRLVSQPLLSGCLLLGMTIVVALAASIPMFVNAAQSRALRQQLNDPGGRVTLDPAAPPRTEPLSLRFSYLSLGEPPLTADEYGEMDRFAVRAALASPLGFTRFTRYVTSERFALRPAPPTSARYPVTDTSPFVYASFETMNEISRHIIVEQGSMPAPVAAPGDPRQVIDVLISRRMSERFGILPGDVFTSLITQKVSVGTSLTESGTRDEEFPVRVRAAGVWRATDPRDPYWLVDARQLDESLIVDESTFFEHFVKLAPRGVSLAFWDVTLDERALTVDLAVPLFGQISSYRAQAFRINPRFDLSSAFVNALGRYYRSSIELSALLLLFSLPNLALILTFVVMIAGMVVRRQERELAILRSRGASSADVFALYVFQGVLLGLLALALGLPLGRLLSALIANVRSFLSFFDPLDMQFARAPFSPTAVQLGAMAAAAGALATVIPALAAARRNVLSFGAERGRNLGRPFWQRAYLDVLLLIPCAYGYLQLSQSGRVAVFGQTLTQDDLFRDPVRFLLPVLTLTALSLVVARVLPLVWSALARALEPWRDRTGAITPVFLALRELARTPKDYTGPLILLMCALAMGLYAASAAKTLDRHLVESTYLRIGADAVLKEVGASSRSPAPVDVTGGVAPSGPDFLIFPPVERHAEIPGVRNYARAALLNATTRDLLASRFTRQGLMLIDRRAFQDVAAPAFREDYASESFGKLMNGLAQSRDGVLVRRNFMDDNGLGVGDALSLLVRTSQGTEAPITYTVRGAFENFPIVGIEVNDQPFIAHMEYTFERLGFEVNYDVLLKLDPEANLREVVSEARKRDFNVMDAIDARARIDEAQQQADRQGLFGILSSGFISVAMLTVLGFVVFILLSHRRRAIEMGVLRALGLSSRQMAAYVIVTQIVLLLSGAAAGSLIGALVSALFVPQLQVSGRLIAEAPRFLVRFGWTEMAWIYVSLMGALALAAAGSLLLLRRFRVFEAVKLGATAG